MKKIIKIIIILLLVLLTFHCNKSSGSVNERSNQLDTALILSLVSPFVNGPVIDYSNRESSGRGRLLTSQLKWDVPRSLISSFVNVAIESFGASPAEIASLTPVYGVRYHAITYETLDVNGNLITASGSIWISDKSGPQSLLLYCHGTSLDTLTDGFASFRTLGGLYAAVGYYAALPDYIGYGASDGHYHPYLHADSLASASIDMIRAAKRFASYNGIDLDVKLFITGTSEGGMAALATNKELEANSAFYTDIQTPTATAPISGPYDLETTTTEYLATNRIFNTLAQPAYIEFILPAYNDIYDINKDLNYYFNEPYVNDLQTATFPRSDWYDVVMNLPYSTSGLLTDTFLSNYNGSGEAALKAAITANNTYNFVPATPVMLYASEGDTQVPSSNTTTAATYFSTNSAPDTGSEILPASAGDHLESMIPLIARSIHWFEGY